MSGVSWLIVLVGLACFCSGAFAFVTHRMFWQRPRNDRNSSRPTIAGTLFGVGAPMLFVPLVDLLGPHEYRLPLQVLAALVCVGVGLILRRLEKKRWT